MLHSVDLPEATFCEHVTGAKVMSRHTHRDRGHSHVMQPVQRDRQRLAAIPMPLIVRSNHDRQRRVTLGIGNTPGADAADAQPLLIANRIPETGIRLLMAPDAETLDVVLRRQRIHLLAASVRNLAVVPPLREQRKVILRRRFQRDRIRTHRLLSFDECHPPPS